MKGKILVVDDEPIVLTAMALELEDEGYHVFKASNLQEAKDLCSQQQFDLVYTDLIMQDASSIDICSLVKKNSINADVVMISGHLSAMKKKMSAFLDCGGIAEYLLKPFRENELIEMTEKIFKKRNQT